MSTSNAATSRPSVFPEASLDAQPLVDAGEAELGPLVALAESLAVKFEDHRKVLRCDEPWFGSFELDCPGKLRTYLVGRERAVDHGILDWRHPLARAFYECAPGDVFALEVPAFADIEGRMHLRAKVVSVATRAGLSSDSRRVVRVAFETLQGAATVDLDERGKASVDAPLAAANARPQTGLPDVFSLITPEQYRLITASRDKPVIIQGRAGSGKTTVALYRVSWLAHPSEPSHGEDVKPVDPSKVLIVMFNRALSSFVRSSLAPLQLEKAKLDTFHAWALGEIKRAYRGDLAPDTTEHPHAKLADALKKRLGILHAVDEFIERQTTRLRAWMNEKLEPYAADAWLERFDTSEEPVVRRLVRLRTEARISAEAAEGSERLRLEQIHKLLVKAVQRMTQYKEELLKLLVDKDLLRKSLPDVSEAALDQLGIYQRAVQRGTSSDTRPGSGVAFSDLAILLRLIQRKNGGFPDGDSDDVDIYDHLVVDEAQDFGAVELSVLLDSVRTRRGVTIVGDRNQKIMPDVDFIGWDALAKELGISGAEVAQLDVGHRSTRPIMQLADSLVGETTQGGRPGELPSLIHIAAGEQLVDHVASIIRTRQREQPNAHVCVVTYWPKVARTLAHHLRAALGGDGIPVRIGHNRDFAFEAGVTVTNMKQVKGLEFDDVLILDPAESCYPNTDAGRRELYTLITRAKEHLDIVCEGQPTSLLDAARKQGLVRESVAGVPQIQFDEDDDEPL